MQRPAILMALVRISRSVGLRRCEQSRARRHIVIPAQTFIEAPADAPADLKISGKFTTGKRVDAMGTIEGRSNGRPTGVKLPFKGQPIQGHSGIKRMADGTFFVVTDNGFGNKANSPDAMLFLSQLRLNWDKGTADRLATIFLRDPDKKVRSASPTKAPMRAISRAPISIWKAFSRSATSSGLRKSSAPISSAPTRAARSRPCSRQ